MALHEVYESMIVEVSASFGFSGFECDPDIITSTLRICPDGVVRKGEKRTSMSGRIVINPFNCWSIESSCQSKDINEHLRELIGRLEGVHKLLDPAFGEPEFGITWKACFLHQCTGPFYEPDVLHGMGLLRATLYQEIIDVDESEC